MAPIPAQTLRCRAVQQWSRQSMQPTKVEGIHFLDGIVAVWTANSFQPGGRKEREAVEPALDLGAGKATMAAHERQIKSGGRSPHPVLPSLGRREFGAGDDFNRHPTRLQAARRPKGR